jgi:hypothetical protein
MGFYMISLRSLAGKSFRVHFLSVKSTMIQLALESFTFNK